MNYRNINGLSIPVSEIGMGCWAIGGPTTFGGKEIGWGKSDREESVNTIISAVESGINFFDTADIYGRGESERILGEVINKYKNIIISTKAGNIENNKGESAKDFSPKHLRESLESSLKRLRRESVEIYLLHGPGRDFIYTDELKNLMESFIKEGKISLYGISGTTISCCLRAIDQGYGNIFEAIYNLLDRRAEIELFPKVNQHKYSFINRVPLASGYLSKKIIIDDEKFSKDDIRHYLSDEEDLWRRTRAKKLGFLDKLCGGINVSSLRFCLSNNSVSVVIPGMRNKNQVVTNIQASTLGSLDPEIIERIKLESPDIYQGWK